MVHKQTIQFFPQFSVYIRCVDSIAYLSYSQYAQSEPLDKKIGFMGIYNFSSAVTEETMTAREYKAMILLETGENISLTTAKMLVSVEADHEAEAIACGKYDCEPIDVLPRRHAEFCWEAMQCGSDCLCGLINHDEEFEVYADREASENEETCVISDCKNVPVCTDFQGCLVCQRHYDNDTTGMAVMGRNNEDCL